MVTVMLVYVDETLRTANEVVVSLFLRCIQKPANPADVSRILDASGTARVTFAYPGPTTGTLHVSGLRGIHPTCREFPPSKTRWWQLKHFLFSSRKLVKIPISDEYFFRWVETTNQKTISGTLSKKMAGDRTYHARAIDDDVHSDFCRIVPVMCWKNDLHQLAMYKIVQLKRESYHLVGGFKYFFFIPLPGEMI